MLLQRKKRKENFCKAGRKRYWYTMLSRTSACKSPACICTYLNMREGAAIIRPMTQLSPKSHELKRAFKIHTHRICPNFPSFIPQLIFQYFNICLYLYSTSSLLRNRASHFQGHDSIPFYLFSWSNMNKHRHEPVCIFIPVHIMLSY